MTYQPTYSKILEYNTKERLMEKVIDSGDAASVIIVECTPNQLRMIANRMELAATQRSLPGEELLYQFSRRITLKHNPAITRTQLEARVTEEVESLTAPNFELSELPERMA